MVSCLKHVCNDRTEKIAVEFSEILAKTERASYKSDCCLLCNCLFSSPLFSHALVYVIEHCRALLVQIA